MSADIQHTLEILAAPGGVFEVRALGRRTASGYYDTDHIEKAVGDIEALEADPDVKGIYVTLNEVNPSLIARRANRIETRLGKDATTSDADIARRRWLLVDLDPIRASGISSTDEEHDQALEMAVRIAEFLKDCFGFPIPVMGDSGNGAHLLYRIDLPNDGESKDLIARCLKAIDAAFCGQGCDIDQAVFNAARISKLYGTLTRKGDNTPERPHRRACLLGVPDPIEVVARETLESLGALVGPEETHQAPHRTTGTGREIDLAAWLDEHRAALPSFHEKTKAPWKSFYIFDVCPWDSSHRDRSAWVGQLPSGALAAGCHHNGCSGRDWHALRDLVGDPRPKLSPKPASVQHPPAPRATGNETGDGDYHLTDAGNSERLVRLFGDDIRYCAPLRQWVVWDGRRWEPDDTHRMLDLATQTAKSIFHEAAAAPESEAFAKWALRSESLTARRAMIDGAVFLVPIRPEEMDAHPNLFNCENGTLDLETMQFREHRKEDLLTKISGVRYDPGAKCPLWNEHLHTVFAGDEDVINAFQAVAGYALLQFNPEQVAFILWGHGKNGKSETVKAIARVMGDYATNIEAATLMESRHADGGRARPDILRLRGSRFVTVTEPGADDVLSESLIKSVTGDHAVTARPLYGQPIEFKPGAKIFISTNYKPKIKGQDEGIWRRIWLFPFDVTIPKEKRQRDYGDLLFEQEGAGIFAWMLAGLQRYLAAGRMDQPAAVQKATQDYRIEMNPAGRFIAEACVIDPRARVGKGDLYTGYQEWCEAIGWKVLGKRKFGEFVATLFDEERDGPGNRFWSGIRRKTRAEIENDDIRIERQVGLDDHTTGTADTSDVISQTFCTHSHEGKVREIVSVMSAPADPPFTAADNRHKEDLTHSPDPADYQHLPRPDFGQKCSACGMSGVTHREKPADFNRRRGTAALCARCFGHLGTTRTSETCSEAEQCISNAGAST